MSLDYIGRRKCGCVIAWMALDYATDEPRELAKTLASWAKSGYSIERMETEETRRQIKARCHCDATPEALPLFPVPGAVSESGEPE